MGLKLASSWVTHQLLPYLHWRDLCSLCLAGHRDPRLFTALVYRHAQAALDTPLQGQSGACAVAECPCMRSLRMILDAEGMSRQFSWFPYCVQHKRQYMPLARPSG